MIKVNKYKVKVVGREDVVMSELAVIINSLAKEDLASVMIAITMGLRDYSSGITEILEGLKKDLNDKMEDKKDEC